MWSLNRFWRQRCICKLSLTVSLRSNNIFTVLQQWLYLVDIWCFKCKTKITWHEIASVKVFRCFLESQGYHAVTTWQWLYVKSKTSFVRNILSRNHPYIPKSCVVFIHCFLFVTVNISFPHSGMVLFHVCFRTFESFI